MNLEQFLDFQIDGALILQILGTVFTVVMYIILSINLMKAMGIIKTDNSSKDDIKSWVKESIGEENSKTFLPLLEKMMEDALVYVDNPTIDEEKTKWYIEWIEANKPTIDYLKVIKAGIDAAEAALGIDIPDVIEDVILGVGTKAVEKGKEILTEQIQR